MTPFLKIFARIAGIIIGLCILTWCGIMLFVHYNKQTFVDIITKQVNEQISGTVTMGGIDITIFKGFPDVSFDLKKLVIRDSLWQYHHKDLLNVEHTYASISLRSVLKKDAYINKLTLEDGNILIYTDSNNISNTNIFRKKEKQQDKEKDSNNPLNNIAIKNVTLSIQNIPKNKDFVLDFKQCDVKVTHTDSGWTANVQTKTHLKSFAFNITKGSYMKDMTLVAALELYFIEERKELVFPLQTLQLDGEPYKLGGTFYFADTPYWFNLDIAGVNLSYNKAIKILTPPIQEKLKMARTDKVDTVNVKVIGKMQYLDTPYVKVNFLVKNKDIVTSQGTLKNCSAKGYFLDEVVEGKGHGDPNSMIYINEITGNYFGITIKAVDASIMNLKNPLLKAKVTSDFALADLNNIIGVNTFRFNKGNASIRLDCKMGLNTNSNITPSINGKVHFDNAAFSYTPRALNFTNASGDVVFRETDVNIDNLKVKSGPNKIELNGYIKNLASLYYTAPEKVVIDCRIKSTRIDLNEYITFLDQRNKTPAQKSANNTPAQIKRFATQLDEIMESSIAKVNLNVNEVIFKKFKADDIRADITLTRSDIQLDHVHVNHAGGTLLLKGSVSPNQQSNRFKLNADLKDVNVKKLFYSFGNFGQKAILDENIEGKISAQIDASGGITYTGDIVPNSLDGKVKFQLREGRLIDFEPLGTIAKLIFFNRDLTNIQIEPLESTLDIKNSNIIINPMLVQTSVINVFTEGVYGIPTGTDILIQVPLRNPKKDMNKNNEKMTEKDLKKGIVINLRATDDNTGKVKIKLGKKR